MPKPSEDLSALFRSLRPDESTFQESANTAAHDATQRWPLFKAVAPEKPQETPALSALERERWANQDKPEAGGRKPALSLPGLSDKMSKGLGKMSVRAVKKTAAVKPAVRREPDQAAAEPVDNKPAENPRIARAAPVESAVQPENRLPNATRALPAESDLVLGDAVPAAFEKKAPVSAPAPVSVERGEPVAGRSTDSFKSIFNRLETKAVVVAKPVGNRSSFMDRLGKR